MNQKNRQGTAAQVARILGRTSPLVFAVTAGMLPASHAQEGITAPTVPAPTPSDITESTDSRPQPEAPSPGNLRVPLGSIDEADSELLRQLLLSHGIELDLSDPTIVDNTLAELINELNLGGLLDSTPDFELLLADASDLTLALTSPDLLQYADMYNNPVMGDSVSRDWTIKWFAGVDKAVNPSKPSEPDELLQGTLEANSSWKISLVSTRPATAKELALIEELYCDTSSTTSLQPLDSVVSESVRSTVPSESDSSSAVSVPPVKPQPTDNARNQPPPVTPQAPEPAKTTARQPVVPRSESDPNDGPVFAETSPEWAIKLISTRPANARELSLIEEKYCDSASTQTPATTFDSAKTLDTDHDRSTQIIEAPKQGSIPQIDIDLAGGALEAPAPTPSIRGQVELNSDLSEADGISTGGIIVSDDVPAGFESLAGPQTSFVDIFYNERKVGSTSVTATAEEFTIDDPEAVTAMLEGIKDPQTILQYLSAPMPTHADKICFGDDDPPGCGFVDPLPVAGIFNQDDLRLDLFLARELQTVQSLQSVRYLPPPDADNTSILSLYAVASDVEGEDSELDLSGRALLGYGKGAGNLLTEFDYNSRTDRQRLRQLKLTHYLRDHEIVAGSYSFSPGGALTDVNLLGLSFATSLKTRVDLENAFSSELVVFLNRRSIVQIVVNDRVYTGASYPAGNQALDTRALPDGTYEVELRIVDPVSGSRVERRVFTKSTQMPPRGETTYNVTAGVPLLFNENHIFPDTTSTGVIGFSLSRRLTDQSAYRVGLLQFGLRSFFQSEFIYLGQKTSFQLANSIGEDSTIAASARLSYLQGSYSAHLSAELFQSDADTTGDEVLARLLPEDFRQLNFSLSKVISPHTFGLRASVREQTEANNENRVDQYAIYYRRPLFRRRHLRGFLDVNLQQDELDRRINFQVRVYADRQSWSHSLLAEASRNDEHETGYQFGLASNWQRAGSNRFDWGFGAHASTGDDGQGAGVQLSLDHPWYLSSASTDWNRDQDGRESVSSVATLSAHLGADRRGVALGGADFAQAGLIVAIQGEPAGAKFDILVNDSKVSTGEIGTPQFIGLQPFEEYTVKLIPQTVLSNGIGEEIYEFSLFPGTVQRIDLLAKRQVLMIATLVNKYGELIEDAVVNTDQSPILIETGGFLQAELSPGDTLRVTPTSGSECEFLVPEAGEDEVMVLDTPLICTEVPVQQPE